MKCLVINLGRSSERLARMSLVFSRIGVDFERVEAIDGSLLSDRQRDSLTLDDGIHAPLTHTEVACFLSHRKAWTMIAEGAEPYGAVFEDDIVISGNGARWLRSDEWIPAGTDAVKLETLGDRTWVNRWMIDLGDGYSLSKLRSTHWGTAGYILSREFAQRLLGESERFSITVDGMLFNHEFGLLGQTTCYQFLPAICAQSRYFENNHATSTSLAGVGVGDLGSFLNTTIDQSVRLSVKPTGLAKLRRECRRIVEKVTRNVSGQLNRRIPFDPRA